MINNVCILLQSQFQTWQAITFAYIMGQQGNHLQLLFSFACLGADKVSAFHFIDIKLMRMASYHFQESHFLFSNVHRRSLLTGHACVYIHS